MNFSETKCEVFQPDEKTKLLAHIWLPAKEPKAVFLGIHGALAHAGDWVTPALYYKEKGIATYALDLRYHGTYSEYNKGGKVFLHIDSYETYVKDIHNFYLWIRARHPKTPIFIISHSNGGLIALKYGLTAGKADDIRGFVISSPWLKNMVAVPKILLALSKVIAMIAPTFAIPPEAITDKLTHDAKITARHYADEKAGLRGTLATAKFAVVSLQTQAWVLENIRNWSKFPVFGVIAGQDFLADPAVSEQALKQIPKNLLTLVIHKDNFHENFNETNRNETFAKISDWMKKYL